MRGHPDDTGSHNKRKTEHVRNNGFNPVWKDATFEFLVKVPELAFLEFKVQKIMAFALTELGTVNCRFIAGERSLPLRQ